MGCTWAIYFKKEINLCQTKVKSKIHEHLFNKIVMFVS